MLGRRGQEDAPSPQQQRKRGGKGEAFSSAGKSSCADRWHSDFSSSDRKQGLSQSRRLTVMRLRFSSDMKWFNTWLCKTVSKRASLCLQPSRKSLKLSKITASFMSFHPHTIWLQLPGAVSTQGPALGAHVHTQRCVGAHGGEAAQFSCAEGHCSSTHPL